MDKKILFILILPFVLLVSGCSDESSNNNFHENSPPTKGFVVKKMEPNKILFIQNISQEEISTSSLEELFEKASVFLEEGDTNGYVVNLKPEVYQTLEVGQKINIWFADEQQDSLPPIVGTKKVEIVND
ncbi:DUF3221 domain-containing protein [Robertmurraya andreesenii]|uniref:DUF3221 domain-containing protein n=1 Tax=Anoxybacillus andreesenii TaxID=1325932 RepID=A0ABT9UZW6_9BACL|nr:DUF3221 domain-containing protein [Robertmurraya andreesenii]MDQ0154243.1 hypothetical protein [Robertmurraya andreesenii]